MSVSSENRLESKDQYAVMPMSGFCMATLQSGVWTITRTVIGVMQGSVSTVEPLKKTDYQGRDRVYGQRNRAVIYVGATKAFPDADGFLDKLDGYKDNGRRLLILYGKPTFPGVILNDTEILNYTDGLIEDLGVGGFTTSKEDNNGNPRIKLEFSAQVPATRGFKIPAYRNINDLPDWP